MNVIYYFNIPNNGKIAQTRAINIQKLIVLMQVDSLIDRKLKGLYII